MTGTGSGRGRKDCRGHELSPFPTLVSHKLAVPPKQASVQDIPNIKAQNVHRAKTPRTRARPLMAIEVECYQQHFNNCNMFGILRAAERAAVASGISDVAASRFRFMMLLLRKVASAERMLEVLDASEEGTRSAI